MEKLNFGEYTAIYYLIILALVLFVIIILATCNYLANICFKKSISINLFRQLCSLFVSLIFMGLMIIISTAVFSYILWLSIRIQRFNFTPIRHYFPDDIIGVFILFWLISLFILVCLLFLIAKYLAKALVWYSLDKTPTMMKKIRCFLISFFKWNQRIVFIITTYMVLFGIYISLPIENNVNSSVSDEEVSIETNHTDCISEKGVSDGRNTDNNLSPEIENYINLITFTLIFTLIGYFNNYYKSYYVKIQENEDTNDSLSRYSRQLYFDMKVTMSDNLNRKLDTQLEFKTMKKMEEKIITSLNHKLDLKFKSLNYNSVNKSHSLLNILRIIFKRKNNN